MAGLEYLATVDNILVHQKIDFVHFATGIARQNRYKIMDTQNEIKYYAYEESSFLTRALFEEDRPFEMSIRNNDDDRVEVIHLRRPNLGCFTKERIEVWAPPTEFAGTVKEVCSFFKPTFKVKDAEGTIVHMIKAPMFQFSCYRSFHFNVYAQDGVTIVSRISNTWGGVMQELFTDADNFRIEFPESMDVKMKAVLIGACFLIHFMYYETKEKQGLATRSRPNW